jgi:adenylate cyclase
MVATISMRRLLGRLMRNAVERERLRGLFGVYVSEEIVEQILKQDRIVEGGERRRVTVCCSDIRGFTTLSETKSPEDLVRLLNRYFDRMCTIVAKHGGVVNKFMGDGMLIVFGAPNRLVDDARRAYAAAQEMAREAARLFETGEFPGLRIGIALHRGEAVVGNVGGSQRREYTVIGDTVNTASRLESLTKEYGCQLVFSETVAAHAGLDVARLERHDIAIRGRVEPLAIHVVADARDLPAALAEGRTPEARQADLPPTGMVNSTA